MIEKSVFEFYRHVCHLLDFLLMSQSQIFLLLLQCCLLSLKKEEALLVITCRLVDLVSLS